MALRPSLVLGPLRQHPGRSAVSVLAIAIGVAMGLAVELVNTAAVSELASSARRLSGSADAVVRGPRSGFDESLYPAMAVLPGVRLASPVLEVETTVSGSDVPLKLQGVDVFRAALLGSGPAGPVSDGLDLLRSDVVLLTHAAAASLDLKPGDTMTVQTGEGPRVLRVGGYAGAQASGTAAAFMDIGAAQSLFHRHGRITRIDISIDPALDRDRFLEGLDLPAGVVAQPTDGSDRTSIDLTRAYRINLDVLALVALFAGALLVFSTQALSVARRRSQLALLRVVGMTRPQIRVMVLAEGACIGAAGTAAGLFGGAGLAALVLHYVGADLGAGFFTGTRPELQIDAARVALFGLVGLAAAVAGSAAPAIEAAAADPAPALKSGDDSRAYSRMPPVWPGLACWAAATLAVRQGPVGGLPLFGYGAMALMLAGTLLLLPHIVVIVAGCMPRRMPVAAMLAVERLKAYPMRAAAGLAAIVAAVGLMVAMAIMVTSFRDSLDRWLGAALPADVYVRGSGRGDSTLLSPAAQARLRNMPGVRRAEFQRWDHLQLNGGAARVTLLARDGAAENADRRLPLTERGNESSDAPRAWVNEAAAAQFGWRPGQDIEIPLSGRNHRFIVAGVWRDYARQNGAILIDRHLFVTLTGDVQANDAALWLGLPQDLVQVRDELERLLPGAEVATFDEVRAVSLQTFDRTFAITYALEAVAIGIGLLGLSSAIGGEVLGRRREFGMLRHLGVLRRDIGRVLAAEGFLMGFIGLLIGSLLGFAMSLVLIHVVNPQSFHWSMELSVPWLGLGAFQAAMLALATATAVASGRQALGTDAVRAVREDW
ncbi:MAG: ABC transporter permease [Betaproteobacteria bacterium]|nr:ABC transporter permease [Betaproteobacteria bacterium]